MIFHAGVDKELRADIMNLSEYLRSIYNFVLQLLIDNDMIIENIKEKEIKELVRSKIPFKKGLSFWEQSALRYAISAYTMWKRNSVKKPKLFSTTFPISVYFADSALISAYKTLNIDLPVSTDSKGKLEIDRKQYKKEMMNIEDKLKYNYGDRYLGMNRSIPLGVVKIMINRKDYIIPVYSGWHTAEILKNAFGSYHLPLLTPYISRIQLFVTKYKKVMLNISFNYEAWKTFLVELRKSLYNVGLFEVHRDFSESMDTNKIFDDTVVLSDFISNYSSVIKEKLKVWWQYASKKAESLGWYFPVTVEDFIKVVLSGKKKFYLYFYKPERYLGIIFENMIRQFYGGYTRAFGHETDFVLFELEKHPIKIPPSIAFRLYSMNKYTELFEYSLAYNAFDKIFYPHFDYPILVKKGSKKVKIGKLGVVRDVKQLEGLVDISSFDLAKWINEPESETEVLEDLLRRA